MKETTKIQLVGGKMPIKKSEYARAYDIFVPNDTMVHVGRQVVMTGFKIALPLGCGADIRPRSGFSLNGMEAEVRSTYKSVEGVLYTKKELVRLDADVLIGLVDADFRGEVGVIIKVVNIPHVAPDFPSDVFVKTEAWLLKDTRVAQMRIENDGGLEEVAELDMTIDRGGGYGHTGTKC